MLTEVTRRHCMMNKRGSMRF